MIKKYILALKVGVLALFAGIAAYYRAKLKSSEAEIKDIELSSAMGELEAQAKAEAADLEALKRGDRRTIDEIQRAKSGDRSHFE